MPRFIRDMYYRHIAASNRFTEFFAIDTNTGARLADDDRGRGRGIDGHNRADRLPGPLVDGAAGTVSDSARCWRFSTPSRCR